MNKIKFLFGVMILLWAVSCTQKETEERSDLEKIKINNKQVHKMDSAQSIQNITQQKVQELLDLSAIYASGNKNTEVDSLIFEQISGYFIEPDSAKINPLIRELDSLKVRNVKVKNLDISQQITENDTLDIASFTLEYSRKDKSRIGFFEKKASYVLKKSPITFVKEFKFYFVDFDIKSPKDSTSVGVIK